MIILSETLRQIKSAFRNAPIESGGIIGSTDNVITAFYFDSDNHNRDCYIPDTAKLNKTIRKWAENGVRFAGLAHSHANDCRILSDADKKYAVELFRAANYPVYFPIVTVYNGEVVLTSYIVEDFQLKKDKITVKD